MNGTAGPKAPVGKYGQPVAPNLSVHHLCSNCQTNPPNIIEEYSHGDLVCGDCGTILGDRIVDTRSEWRTFAGDEGGDDPSRVGGPTHALLPHGPLETSISGRDGHSGMARDLQRTMNRANQQTAGPGGRSITQLKDAWRRIAEICEFMKLTWVTQQAQHAYQIGEEAKVGRGRNDVSLIAASIIYATRVAKAGRSFREVAKVTGVTKSELGKVYNALRSAILADQKRNGVAQPEGLVQATKEVEGLIIRFCNHLALEKKIENAAKDIADRAVQKSAIDGRSPLSIAAGVVYFTCTLLGKPMTAKEIADVAGVSESTIKLICKKVAEKLDDVIDPEWKENKDGYEQLLILGRQSAASGTARPSRSGTPSVSTPTPAAA